MAHSKKHPKPSLVTLLQAGETAFGYIKCDWKPNGFTFIKIVGGIDDGGEVVLIADHTDVFLHSNEAPDLELFKDDKIAFRLKAGKKKGQLEAYEVMRVALIVTTPSFEVVENTQMSDAMHDAGVTDNLDPLINAPAVSASTMTAEVTSSVDG